MSNQEEEVPIYDYDDENEANQTAPVQKQAQNFNTGGHSSFNDFSLKQDLLRSVKEAGFERPSEVQHQCIPNAIHGKDVLCQAKAGTGKTAVFVLSVLNQLPDDAKPFSCLVLCHTRELAFQIKNEFKRLGKFTNFKVKAVYGGVEESVDIHTLKTKKPHILVATPGRCLSLIKAKPAVIETQNIEYFIIDECDRVLSSNKMRSDVQNIFYELPRKKQVMMFSGTMSDESKKTCRKFLQDQIEIFVEDNSKLVLHGLEQFHIKIEEKQKISVLRQLLDQGNFNQVIIFVNKQDRAKYLSKYLTDKGHDNAFIYRNLDQSERTKIYSEFKEGKNRVLVATDLVGRGIDIERVNLVINFDMPQITEDYMHRVGRAGRFETKGQAISFISTKEDEKVLAEIQSTFSTQIKEYSLKQEAQ
ncbi:hypothetical protein ABPG74_022795 [Tetrahymena malaccensis]